MSASSTKEASSAATLKVKASPSLLPNNLSVSDSLLAYVHRSEVHLFKNQHSTLASGGASLPLARCAYSEKDAVSQAKLCRLAVGDVLVLVTTTGLIHMYDGDGQKLLHFLKVKAAGDKEGVLRGIAHDGKETVIVGGGGGDLHVLSVTVRKISETRMLAHSDGITDVCLHTEQGLLATADEAGCVVVWCARDGKFTKQAEFKGYGEPCWSVSIGHGFVTAAYATGHIRVFNLEGKPQLQVEIAAHARSILALSTHPTLPLVSAAAEDGFVSVWTLPIASVPVSNVLLANPITTPLTGVSWAGEGGSLLVVIGYDSRFVFVYETPSVSS